MALRPRPADTRATEPSTATSADPHLDRLRAAGRLGQPANGRPRLKVTHARIKRAMDECRGVRSRTAAAVGVSIDTLARWLGRSEELRAHLAAVERRVEEERFESSASRGMGAADVLTALVLSARAKVIDPTTGRLRVHPIGHDLAGQPAVERLTNEERWACQAALQDHARNVDRKARRDLGIPSQDQTVFVQALTQVSVHVSPEQARAMSPEQRARILDGDPTAIAALVPATSH